MNTSHITATPQWRVRRSSLAALAFAAVLLSACGGGGSGSNSQPYNPAGQQSQPGSISGRVLSASNGQPVAGASVTLDATTVTTGADGSFSFTGLTQVDRVAVTIAASGFAQTMRFTTVTGGTNTTLPVQLVPVASTVTVDAAVGGTATVPGSTAQVIFQPGTIVTSTGAAPTQPVLVRITALNLAQDSNLVSGDYRTTNNGAAEWLESYGALSVVLTDATGGSYNLAAGQSATIRIPAATRADTLPATVPLYWFNEATGMWVNEGTATLGGASPNLYYEGSVTQIATWSATDLIDTVLVSGCVTDMRGSAIRRARVEVDGVTYSGTSSALTDNNGGFSIPVRRDAEVAVMARSDSRLSNARGVSTAAANTSIGAGCLVIADAAVSIKLTWGRAPSDVDSHLLTPQGAHVYWDDKGSLAVAPYANLDIDDVTSYGPEFITIRRLAQGTYRYFLDNYSGTFGPGMTGSPVKVELTHDGNTTVYAPGAGEGAFTFWHAFDIVVDSQCNVTVTPVGAWSATAPANPNQNGGAVTYCD
ncbi:carboxypeptidase regulatory-like domain-containing protein [Rhizobacter sp. J219]|uniref:carboxypeptidase regulatory-like domain-containing protein n=1 Tax=Rhizobacter sp. J219 TaxID=2898430 RepID=UPI002150AF8D|nr:carboxypeptidase regulatory-like domain-containing protein [Rhizobacter sp. J219]MCR5884757.1 carboxypeptidase regulatory-like domain-containing protein [Rhizobacter sp. J219]